MEATPEAQLTLKQRKAFGIARNAAQKVLKRRARLFVLVRDAYKKLAKNEDAVSKVSQDVRVLLRLTKAWGTKQYRGIPWRSVLYAVAALIYFVNPVDVIPDALLGIGFVDDVAVLTAVISAIQKDLIRFQDWELKRLSEGG